MDKSIQRWQLIQNTVGAFKILWATFFNSLSDMDLMTIYFGPLLYVPLLMQTLQIISLMD